MLDSSPLIAYPWATRAEITAKSKSLVYGPKPVPGVVRSPCGSGELFGAGAVGAGVVGGAGGAVLDGPEVA